MLAIVVKIVKITLFTVAVCALSVIVTHISAKIK